MAGEIRVRAVAQGDHDAWQYSFQPSTDSSTSTV